MSNPDKKIVDDIEAEKEDSNEQLRDEEEVPTREIVLGLPALSIRSQNIGVGSVTGEEKEEEARLNEQAVIAAELLIAAAGEAITKGKNEGGLTEKGEVVRLKEQAVVAAELLIAAAGEAVTKGKNDGGGSDGKKKSQKGKKMRKLTDINDEAGGSGEGETKKPRRRASELINPPPGPPVCNICGKGFGSWKAVFGHLRSHKDRNYQGFNPPPTFSTAVEKFTIPGPNSAFVRVTAGAGSSGGVATGGGSASGGEGGRRLEIDLNEPLEEMEEDVTEGELVAKFDLNKSPPKDEEEKGKGKGKGKGR